jgi:hypothetical protein
MPHSTSRAFAFATALLLAGQAVQAADTPGDPGPNVPRAAAPADPLSAARKLLADKKWAAAIDELKKVNATGNADWNNLMGYSHRKARTPDLAAAERFYEAALRIDPGHKGALEYAGELALMQGNLPLAEQRLATLARICAGKCEEHEDLKNAIGRFKANGNKHVAASN